MSEEYYNDFCGMIENLSRLFPLLKNQHKHHPQERIIKWKGNLYIHLKVLLVLSFFWAIEY